jgi:hypothetical protein
MQLLKEPAHGFNPAMQQLNFQHWLPGLSIKHVTHGNASCTAASHIHMCTLHALLLQEGHTAHATAEEAEEEAMRFVRIYEQFATLVAGMPVVAGRKSRIESFAGVWLWGCNIPPAAMHCWAA